MSWIETKLKQAGSKLTTPRRAVASWIEKNEGVFSAKEIIRDLPDLDTVSVYRTLERLADIDAIHQALTVHGEIHYEKHTKQKHHHHAVCTQCEKTKCIKSCDIPVKKVTGFKNIHHTLVFTGLCNACS